MNWFSALIILAIITISWTAPIDQLDSSVSHKYNFNHINTTTFAPSVDANSFTEISQDLVSNTEIVATNTEPNVSEYLPKELDTDVESKITEEKINFLTTSLRPWEESSTGRNEALQEDTTLFNDHESQAVSYSTNASQHFLSTKKGQVDQIYTKISNKIGNFSNDVTLYMNSEKTQYEISQSLETSTVSNAPVAENTGTQSETIFEQTTEIFERETTTHTSSDMPAKNLQLFTETFDQKINQKDIPSPNEAFLQTTTSNSQFSVDKLHKDFGDLLDSDIRLTESVTKSKELSASHQDSDMVRNSETTINDLIAVTLKSDTDPDHKLPVSNYVTEEKQLTEEETTTIYAMESTTENPIQQQTVDTFVNLVTTFGHNTGTATEEYVSLIHTTTEPSNTSETSAILNKSITKTEINSDPSFKQEPEDSSIENVLGVESKMDLRPEHINVKLVLETNALLKDDNITLTSSLEQPSHLLVSLLKKAIEDTTSALEILKETHNNKSTEDSNSDRLNISIPMEYFSESAAINTATEYKSKEDLQSAYENSIESINHEEQSTLGNFSTHFEVSKNPAAVENFLESTKAFVEDQQHTDKLITMKSATESTQTYQESIGDKAGNSKEIFVCTESSEEQNKRDDGSKQKFKIEENTEPRVVVTTNTTQHPQIETNLATRHFEDAESSTNEYSRFQTTTRETKLSENTVYKEEKLKFSSEIINNDADETDENLNDISSHTNKPFATSASYPLMQTTSSTIHSLTEQTTRLQENHSTSIVPTVRASITYKEDFTTLSPLESTTDLPKSLEEEEEVTTTTTEEPSDDNFEEMQDKIRAENDQLQKSTTLRNTSDEQSISAKSEGETTAVNSILEHALRSGVIRQNFVDTFADYYEQSTIDIGLVMETQKHVTEPQKSGTDLEKTTEMPFSFTTIVSKVKTPKTLEGDHVNIPNSSDEGTAATTVENSIRDENTATTENISETTVTSTLRKSTISASLNKVPPTHGLLTTTPTTEATVITSIMPSRESFLQQMVSHIDYTDTTTSALPMEKENEEYSATSRTEQTLMQTSPMQDLQQQIESTTLADVQPLTSIDIQKSNTETTEHQAREPEDRTSSTSIIETEETTSAPVELARSLSLPPPKFEYLQSADGVEVFYGYSIVKHN